LVEYGAWLGIAALRAHSALSAAPVDLRASGDRIDMALLVAARPALRRDAVGEGS
jgi:hypothetical protein